MKEESENRAPEEPENKSSPAETTFDQHPPGPAEPGPQASPPQEGEPEAGPIQQTPRRVGGLARFFLWLVFVFVASYFFQLYIAKPYTIPSGSMIPTLKIGERMVAERISFRLGAEPKVGEVVVFHPPLNATPGEQDPVASLPYCGRAYDDVLSPCPESGPDPSPVTYVKRVVAGPGDRIKIEGGVPIVNGKPLEGDWQSVPCRTGICDLPQEITVPEDHFFMMGDNRPNSLDSRMWGPVPREWLIGRALFTYWPIPSIGGL